MLVAVVLLLLSACMDGQDQNLPDAEYYPLSLGKSWTYAIQDFAPPAKHSTVTWTVTLEEPVSPTVYQVWPKPMQVDDEAIRLRVTKAGIEDADSKVYIMKFPLASGATWQWGSGANRGQPDRSFRVSSAGFECTSGTKKYPHCATIEDIDRRLNLRTITTYAHGVGPVKFDYYRKTGTREILIRTMVLEGTR